MLKFSKDGPTADKQMRAVIFYLTTFGYIDGDFDQSEREFVRNYVRKLVESRVNDAVPESDQKLRAELTLKFTTHFHEVFEGIDRQVKELFTEAVAEGEAQDNFVHAKLKLRCFEIFKSFDQGNQEQLMDTIDELIQADGQVHPAEAKFRGELAALLEEDMGVELIEDDADSRTIAVAKDAKLVPAFENHPFFEQFEHHYTTDATRLRQQVEADRNLIDQVIAQLAKQAQPGAGKLAGKKTMAEFRGSEPFLDGHVHVLSPKPGREYELIVVGDLHGCYSCLKAVLMQSDFFAKVNDFVNDPEKNPEPKLVLLGDYIDRGMFSYQGVLRSAMQLFLRAPDHVYLLRGNHEYYIEHQGRVLGAVRPSEAMDTLKPHLSQEVFAHYMQLFDALPNMLFFEKILFVHGGIARDLLLKEKYKDLSSLNEWDIRFQMMWSDPSSADVIPASLQEQSSRFPFGRLQSQAFLQRVGCHTLVRGHEKVDEGFRRVYDDASQLLITLFSAGGHDNKDLPADSSYRSVTPMAMTVRYKDGKSEIVPWKIDYARYNSPDTNKFFESRPEESSIGPADSAGSTRGPSWLAEFPGSEGIAFRVRLREESGVTGTPFDQASYISLATYRKDGSVVPTPVWVAPLDGKLVVFTLRETFKVKRVESNPAVRVAQCDVRGTVQSDWRDGTCAIVTDPEREKRAYAALRKKYGLMMRLGDVMSTLTGRMKRRVVLEITLG